MANRGRVSIVLAINILVSRLGFFKISGMTVSSANKKFIPK
jgi:hypothetical protein